MLETVEVDRGCFACMLGGPDGRMLHIVATDWERLDWQHGGGERTGQVLTYRALRAARRAALTGPRPDPSTSPLVRPLSPRRAHRILS